MQNCVCLHPQVLKGPARVNKSVQPVIACFKKACTCRTVYSLPFVVFNARLPCLDANTREHRTPRLLAAWAFIMTHFWMLGCQCMHMQDAAFVCCWSVYNDARLVKCLDANVCTRRTQRLLTVWVLIMTHFCKLLGCQCMHMQDAAFVCCWSVYNDARLV